MGIENNIDSNVLEMVPEAEVKNDKTEEAIEAQMNKPETSLEKARFAAETRARLIGQYVDLLNDPATKQQAEEYLNSQEVKDMMSYEEEVVKANEEIKNFLETHFGKAA